MCLLTWHQYVAFDLFQIEFVYGWLHAPIIVSLPLLLLFLKLLIISEYPLIQSCRANPLFVVSTDNVKQIPLQFLHSAFQYLDFVTLLHKFSPQLSNRTILQVIGGKKCLVLLRQFDPILYLLIALELWSLHQVWSVPWVQLPRRLVIIQMGFRP